MHPPHFHAHVHCCVQPTFPRQRTINALVSTRAAAPFRHPLVHQGRPGSKPVQKGCRGAVCHQRRDSCRPALKIVPKRPAETPIIMLEERGGPRGEKHRSPLTCWSCTATSASTAPAGAGQERVPADTCWSPRSAFRRRVGYSASAPAQSRGRSSVSREVGSNAQCLAGKKAWCTAMSPSRRAWCVVGSRSRCCTNGVAEIADRCTIASEERLVLTKCAQTRPIPTTTVLVVRGLCRCGV